MSTPQLKLIVTERSCPHCGVTKPVADFRVDQRRKQPRSWCRRCENDASHARGKEAKKRKPYWGFRTVIDRARKAGLPCDVTVQYLTGLWREQEGRCALSGLQMTWRQGKLLHTSISVDRIVAGLGYVKGNVRLVCFAFNAFRGSGTDEDMIRLAKALIKHQRSK